MREYELTGRHLSMAADLVSPAYVPACRSRCTGGWTPSSAKRAAWGRWQWRTRPSTCRQADLFSSQLRLPIVKCCFVGSLGERIMNCWGSGVVFKEPHSAATRCRCRRHSCGACARRWQHRRRR